MTARTTACENCGTFIPIAELGASRTLGYLSERLLGRRLASLSLSEITTILAWVPLLIGPPVAALVIVGLTAMRDPAELRRSEWQRPVLIALLNIALSLIVWRLAAQGLQEWVRDAADFLRELMGGRATSPPAVKAVPI